jgi:Secretion system C-terminal sorting domain
MKKKILLMAFVAVTSAMLYGYKSGAASRGGVDGTGASGGGGCGSCHSSGTTDGVKVELDSAGVAVTSYVPGGSYTVKISGTNGSTSTLSKFGFQLAVVNASGAGTNPTDAGTWGTIPTTAQLTTAANSGLPETIIEQKAAITATTGTGANGTTYAESIPWTAPAAGTGSVVIYGVINEVNGNGNESGDKYQKATPVTITEAAPVAPAASVTISITGGTNPTCSGVGVTFTATPVNGGSAPTYQWLVGGTNAGTGASFTTSTITSGQSVTCVMTSNLSGVTGSPATSNAVSVVVNTATVPTISKAGNVLTSTSASTYQWAMNGAAINGATTQSYTYSQSGSYTVQITDANGCSANSAATVINTTGVLNTASQDELSVYPNPSAGNFQVNIGQDMIGADIRILDYNGRVVYAGKAEFNNNNISVDGAAGIYLLQVNKDGKTLVKKIIKF